MKNEAKKKYVVAATGRSNEIPEKLGEYGSREEAAEHVREDMRGYCDDCTWVDGDGATHGPEVYDEDEFYIKSSRDGSSRRWSITEVDC